VAKKAEKKKAPAKKPAPQAPEPYSPIQIVGRVGQGGLEQVLAGLSAIGPWVEAHYVPATPEGRTTAPTDDEEDDAA
jgi:hypothetical protein